MTRTCKKIIEIYRKFGVDLQEDAWEIRRTKAGRHQRAQGAWSWFLHNTINSQHRYSGHCGSQWPATEIIRNADRCALYVNPQNPLDLDLLIEPIRHETNRNQR